MSREMKFRYFDLDYMSNPFTLIDIQLSKVSFNRDVIFMQWTGLTDKNGKEVFEGDLIKWAIGGGIVQEVYWNTKECAFYSRPVSKDNTESWLDNTCEVIGNIHQDAQLLK